LTTKSQQFTINPFLQFVGVAVAINDKDLRLECRYKGDHDLDMPKCVDDENPVSPSSELARTITIGVLAGRRGKFHPTKHFHDQMKLRGFDIFDMEYVIRNGACIEGGVFCASFRNHKYTFRGNIDGTHFDAVFALSADLQPITI
jgi:hypothetical protein